MNGDQEFDGIVALARGLHQAVTAARAAKTAARAATTAATRARRNARRRAAYVPVAQRPPAVPADDDYEPHCRCYIAPPCAFCTSSPEDPE